MKYKIGKDETISVVYQNRSGEVVAVLTFNKFQRMYVFYTVLDAKGNTKKIAKGTNPSEVEKAGNAAKLMASGEYKNKTPLE